MEDILKAVAANAELRAKLTELWKAGADSSELASALSEAGFDVPADEVERILFDMQAERGEDIGFQDVDVDKLEQLAGGGSGVDCDGADDCDNNFKDYRWDFHHERCEYWNACDECFSEI